MANHVPMRLGKLVSEVIGVPDYNDGLEEFCQLLRDSYDSPFGNGMLELVFDIFKHRRVMVKMLKEGSSDMDRLQYLLDNQTDRTAHGLSIPLEFTINELLLDDPIPFKDFPEGLPHQTHSGPATLQ